MKPAKYRVTRTRAVIAFFLGCLFFFYAFLQRVSTSVVTEELMRDLSVGGAALGILSAMYFYPYALVQLPVGLLIDRFGPRKLMAATAMICALASWWFSSADTLWVASISRAFIGVTVGFGFVGALSIASMFFPPARFAMLSGFVMTVGMAGAIAGQLPLRVLVEYSGWRETFAVLALLAMVLSVLIYLLVPRRNTPEEALELSGDVPARESPSNSIMSGLAAVSANAQSWFCAGAGFGMSATMLCFAGLWAVPWMTMTMGFDSKLAAGVSSLLFIGWGVTAPIVGWLSDQLGRRKPIVLCGAMISLVSVCLMVYADVTQPLWLGVLFFINGAGSCCMVICFGLCRELNHRANSATAIGLVNMCVVASGAVLQPLIGWLLDQGWDGQLNAGARVYTEAAFQSAFLVLAAAALLGLLCAWRVKESWCQQLEIAPD